MGHLPNDVETLVPWFGLIRCMQSVARSGGHAVVTLRVVVDADGKPIQWAEPSVTLLEPLTKPGALAALLVALTDG